MPGHNSIMLLSDQPFHLAPPHLFDMEVPSLAKTCLSYKNNQQFITNLTYPWLFQKEGHMKNMVNSQIIQ
jgi:hypothetical protein